ncbi:MAG: RNase adapter RapZ [Actinomycetaceae bacterium]|nr:RNase adapter RapZ [Actinomycetaceae bacterium]
MSEGHEDHAETPPAVPQGIRQRDVATPAPLPLTNEVLIITGMSGGGRTGAARALEDLDWYVVDNLPPAMLPALVGMMDPNGAVGGVHRLAVVVDVRSRSFFADFRVVMERLKESGVAFRILFLEADEATLVRRYESNRRPHPLQSGGTILDGIRAEAELLGPLRRISDEIIDTSRMSVHDLTRHIRDVIAGEAQRPLQLTVMSFGFKHGLPLDADHVCDVRFLKNPFWVDELRHLTGKDEAVATYVLNQQGARDFAAGYADLLAPMLDGYLAELKPFATIAIGCTGGKHRSVAMTEFIGARLRNKGFTVRVLHRDLGRE